MLAGMAEQRFQNSRDRLNRAHTHYQAFTAEWSSLLDKESAAPVVRQDKNTGWRIFSAALTPESLAQIQANNLSLILGEMAYQLRAALDGLIWDAITYTQGSEPSADAKGLSRLEFPLSPTWKASDFDKDRFHGFPFPQKLIDWMRTVQPDAAEKLTGDPERGLKATLEDIHDLARFDRHRRLRIVAAVPTEIAVSIETTPPGGSIVAYEWLGCDLLGGKYDFLRLKVLLPGGLVPYHVRLKTNITFDISVESVRSYDGDGIAVQLARFLQAVELVINRFESEFA